MKAGCTNKRIAEWECRCLSDKILLVSSSRRIAADTVEQVQSQVQTNRLLTSASRKKEAAKTVADLGF
jgi:hypothetical protein